MLAAWMYCSEESSNYWSFVYIRKTYVDQLPKPQKVQILKMHAFSVKCAHFHLICIKCMHFPENVCILCKLDENVHIFLKCSHFMQIR